MVSQQKVSFSPRLEYLLWLVVLLVMVGVVFPHLNDYAWDYDEGPTLQAAALSHAGYTLYDEVVSNKPPLLTWYLQLAFIIGGVSLTSARLAILLLNGLGVLALGGLAKLWWGRGAGLLTIILFVLLPETAVRLPVVMPDLPVMSFMLISIMALTLFRRNGRLQWTAVSAAGYGIVLGFHPLFIFMFPVLGLMLIWPRENESFSKRLLFQRGLVFGGVSSAIILLWLLPVWGDGFIRWVYAYNSTRLGPDLLPQLAQNGPLLWAYLSEDQGLLVLLSMLSGILLWGKRPFHLWLGIILLWFYLTVLTLYLLQPMWEHYRLLTMYPLILLTGGGLKHALLLLQQKKRPLGAGLITVGCLLLMIINLAQSREWVLWQSDQLAAKRFLETELPPAQIILSDNQFLVFTAGHFTPPELVDTSSKRISTGYLTTADVINTHWRYQSQYIMFSFGRFAQLSELADWVTQTSSRTHDFGDIQIYQLPPLPEIKQAVSYQLEPGIHLRGYNIGGDTMQAGSPITLTLFWEITNPITEDYHRFIHLLDEAGNLVGQADGVPTNGFVPTSNWQTGILIPDTVTLDATADLLPGNYALMTGLYQYPSLVRVPAFLNTGEQLSEDMIPITIVQIQ